MKQHLKTFAVFFFVTLLTGLMVWPNEKVRDDDLFFHEKEIDISFSALKTLSGQSYFHELPTNSFSYYRPFTRYLYRVENRLFQGNLAYYHFLGLLLQAVLMTFIYLLLKEWGVNSLGACVLSLFVGLHPLSHSFWVYKTGVIDILAAIAIVLALLLVQRGGLKTVVISALCLFCGQFVKELVILGWLLVVLDMWRRKNTQYLLHFVSMTSAGASIFLWMRSQVVLSPPLLKMLGEGDLLAAMLRESLWSPVWAFTRPDLCHQGRHVLVSGDGSLGLTIIAGLFWLALVYYVFKTKNKNLLLGIIVYWMFWSLALPNSLTSTELITYGQPTRLLYVPDHLLFFPLLIALLPLAKKIHNNARYKYLALTLLLVNLMVSAVKVTEWQNTKVLFESMVQHRPLRSQPYRALGRIYYDETQIAKAHEVLQLGIEQNFENSELYRMNAICLRDLNRREEALQNLAKARQIMRKEVIRDIAIASQAPDGQRHVLTMLKQKITQYPNDPLLLRELKKRGVAENIK